MATLSDIAMKTGLSLATVSHVLNGRKGYRLATRDRVLKAARELDYRPNHLSRSLLGGKSMSIGLIGKGLSLTLANNHARYLTMAAREAGYLTYAVNIAQRGDDSETLVGIARQLLDRRVDGLVIYRNMPISTDARRFLESRDVPVVFMGDWGPPRSRRRIVLDFESGIKQMAEHLAELGHRRAAMFPGSGLADFPEHKLRPYQRHFGRMGIELLRDRAWEIETSSDRMGKQAHEAVRRFLVAGQPATVLLMGNDIAAAGAIAAVRDAGLSVPDDLSVVGFDNLDGSEYGHPPLTTITGPPPNVVGQAAFDMLHALMADQQATVQRQVFAFELVVRGSTAEKDRVRPLPDEHAVADQAALS